MFAGINMFWPLLNRLILARVTSEKGPWNIYAQEHKVYYYYQFGRQRKKKWQQNSVNNFFFTNDARKWREKWRLLDFDWLHTLPDCLIVTFHWSISISPLKVLSIGKSGFKSQNLDLRISNRTQNLTTDFVADSLIGNPCRVRISINKIRREIRFRILCSIGNPKIQILRSKSRFPNRTHPKICSKIHGIYGIINSKDLSNRKRFPCLHSLI